MFSVLSTTTCVAMFSWLSCVGNNELPSFACQAARVFTTQFRPLAATPIRYQACSVVCALHVHGQLAQYIFSQLSATALFSTVRNSNTCFESRTCISHTRDQVASDVPEICFDTIL